MARAPRGRRGERKAGLAGRLFRGLVWVAAACLAIVASAWWAARPAVPDAFYDPPAQRPAEPGALLRHESFDRALPAGMRGWRILYTTTRADGVRAVASALVLAPVQGSGSPPPVVAWAHGTMGLAPGCAPSVVAKPFANVPALDDVARQGWAVVATDYVGLGVAGGHAYLIGEEAARGVLDAVRAARRLPGLSLGDRTVVWGHSQGGGSALWTGARAPDYAPDVAIAGVAALAPASDLVGLVATGKGSMFGKIVSAYLVRAYAAAYPEIDADAWVRRRARLWVDDLAKRCVGGLPTLLSAAETALLPADGIFSRDPTQGALGERLRANSETGPIAAPLLIAQGAADDLVLPDVQARYVAARCAAGQALEHRVYAGLDHLSLVAPGSPLGPDLIRWTRERFAGVPATSTCLPKQRRSARPSPASPAGVRRRGHPARGGAAPPWGAAPSGDRRRDRGRASSH